jgi:23S rRNA (uracil-5-)-methyltransferase RumA
MLTPKLFRRQIIDLTRTMPTVAPNCPHAPPQDFCGGCTFQHVSYADQVAAKQQAMRQLWASHLPADVPDPVVVASPNPLGYRTRMDFIASKGRFGLRRGGKFNYIVDLSTCHLVPTPAFAIAHRTWQSAMQAGLSDYNLRSHEGFLRYIVVRRSPQDRYLLALVTTSPDEHQQQIMADLAQQVCADADVVGFHWLINDGVADMSFGTPFRHWGAELLPMHVGNVTLSIGPNTFFQNNIYLLDHLLTSIKTAVGDAQQVADLYGGVGTIALSLADQVGHVHCVESMAESIALCQHNIAQSQRSNVTAEVADVADFLAHNSTYFDTIVVDPPRAGLGAEVCAQLNRCAPQKLIYVSCNPLSQLDDFQWLHETYRLTALTGYDMFPQTPHFESLAIFERR